MKKILWIVFVLIPMTVCPQEPVHVNIQYNKAEKDKELTVEIINREDGEMGVPNTSISGDFFSYFELHFYDKSGVELPVTYHPPSFGVPFCNGSDIQRMLIIKPLDSMKFKYSIENLFSFCKEPEKIKKMKLKFHIRYGIQKDDKIVKQGTYEQYSRVISF